VALPRKPDQHSGSRQAELHILRVLEFNPENLKCGAVALSNDAPLGAALFFVKGPPLVIKELVQPSTVPHDFDEVRKEKNETRKDYAFRRQFNEKPSIIPGCPGL